MLNALVTAVLTEVDFGGPEDDVVLDAALNQAVAFGLDRMTMDDVARAAGIGRMTVYRRYGTKDELLRRLLAREANRLVVTVANAAAGAADLTERIVEAFVATLKVSREHPLVERLVRVEPESLFALADLDQPDLVALARAFVAKELRRAKRNGEIGDVDVDHVAEAVVRLVVSFVVLPRSVVDVSDERAARSFARTVIVPMLTGGRPA